ncbi:9158_t:CDS:2 [Gigaspora margarita]|uniref:9158_t:CDS:1 n=1 Tax=Gigaspora margarita TaxID=4874 RepID=A0ABN7UIJ8_GIGMA|nr:9158_t:CDS:2 [Gigaspora margarita]
MTLRGVIEAILFYLIIQIHNILKILLADKQFLTILTSQIQNQVKVWLIDYPESKEYEYFVNEIVYQYNQL